MYLLVFHSVVQDAGLVTKSLPVLSLPNDQELVVYSEPALLRRTADFAHLLCRRSHFPARELGCLLTAANLATLHKLTAYVLTDQCIAKLRAGSSTNDRLSKRTSFKPACFGRASLHTE